MEDMISEALERGRKEGRLNTMIESVRSLKANLGLNDQQIKDTLSISNEDREQIIRELESEKTIMHAVPSTGHMTLTLPADPTWFG